MPKSRFNPDGDKIVSSNSGGGIRLWDIKTGDSIDILVLDNFLDMITSVAFSPSGEKIVVGDANGVVRLFDIMTGEQIGDSLLGHNERFYITGVAFSPDGKKIISASGDGTVRLWISPTENQIDKPFVEHNSAIHSVAFHPSLFSGTGEGLIISGDEDGAILFWDVSTSNTFVN